MSCCTYAVLMLTLTVVVGPLFAGKVIDVDQKTGDIKDEVKLFINFILATCFTVVKFLIFFAGLL